MAEDQEIQAFKHLVDLLIGNKNTPQSIPPMVVAAKLKDLADILASRKVDEDNLVQKTGPAQTVTSEITFETSPIVGEAEEEGQAVNLGQVRQYFLNKEDAVPAILFIDDLTSSLTLTWSGHKISVTADALSERILLIQQVADNALEIAENLITLGETSTTAYRGDRGKIAYDHSQSQGNPHGTTKAHVGLGNAANLAPADLPISTAQSLVNAANATAMAGKADLDGGVLAEDQIPDIPSANLPEVNIFPLFDPTYFKVGTNGMIQPVDAEPGLPKPAAPTGGVVDDTADTFAFTMNPLFTIGQHEYSKNTGSTWSTCTSETIAIGDFSLVIGQLLVRVAAEAEVNQAGFTLANTEAFTASGGSGWTDIDDEWESANGGQMDANVVRTGNSLSTIGSGQSLAYTSLTLEPGVIGSIRAVLNSYAFVLWPAAEANNMAENLVAYATIHYNDKLMILSYPSGQNGYPSISQEFTGYPNSTPVLIEMELTLTEAIWYQGDARTELFRCARQAQSVRIVCDCGGGGLENIQQKGFTNA